MWKKTTGTEDPRDRSESATTAAVTPKAQSTTTPPTPGGKPARIGPSLSFKGDLFGEEDLLIEGKVEGRIVVKRGAVTIGEKGRVEADIEATNIQVAGSVKGDLSGADRVVLLETGRVEGNIKAKSVTLENGCRFKGSIDMESEAASAKKDAATGPSVVNKTHSTPPVARAGV